jgi:DNA-binding NtrC family response regulator
VATRVLIADDQADVLEALSLLLRAAGFEVVGARSPSAVLAAAQASELDCALVDLNYARDTTSGAEGLSLLDRLAALDAELPVVVMTAWATVEGAVEAMRHGARDYVAKPWDNARLVATVRAQAELCRALRKARRLAAEAARHRAEELPPLVAESPAMKAVLEVLTKIAPADAAVLVTGEHGTGKEVVARWIHAASPRADKTFLAVNAGGLPDGVFASELFGHVRGAFTDAKQDRTGCFELADEGTLLLDEIANMPPGQQAQLLRVLQTGEFCPVGSSRTRKTHARVIAATNADVAREVQEGRFRADLYYRLNTLEIKLPPLRERSEDIPILAGQFLTRYAARYRQKDLRFTPRATLALGRHPWPGNVRELEHAIERAVLLLDPSRDEVDVGELPFGAAGATAAREPMLEELTLEDAERILIDRALKKAAGSVPDAAKALGLSRSALYRRLQQLGWRGT